MNCFLYLSHFSDSRGKGSTKKKKSDGIAAREEKHRKERGRLGAKKRNKLTVKGETQGLKGKGVPKPGEVRWPKP